LGSDIMKRRWNESDMADLHDLDHLPRDAHGFLLLHKLRKDAFEIGEPH
jgi:hypothetical protein